MSSTLTARPPRSPGSTHPPGSSPRPRAGGHAPAEHSLASDLSATIPLALFSVAVAAGFARVFSGWQFFDNLLVIVVAGHGLGLVLRRVRVPGVLAVPLLAAVLVWLIGYIHYRSSYSLLLPNSETYQLFTDELRLIGDQFATAVAPVIYGGGWDVLASVGVALAVLLGDTFAFRAYGRAEALVPGGVLFVFVAALGDDRNRVALSVALVGTGAFATAMLRAYHTTVRRSTIGGVRSAASLALPGALIAAVVIAATAGWVGPRLPGAGEEAIYDTTEGGTDVSVQNPLVDIRRRLTNQRATEVFTVEAAVERPPYWRTATLAEFDGQRWMIPDGTLGGVDDGALEARPTSEQIVQRVRVSSLTGNLVPAAPDPRIVQGGPGVEIEPHDGMLIKVPDDLVPGEQFDIVSDSPSFPTAVLQTATSQDAGDPIYTELPDNFPQVAAELALQQTAPATTPFDKAILLQDWFRNEFDYSLEAQPGHGSNAIEVFLREKVGYCEQFAGTYAAMMRSLGYPARVAVGYTSGDQTQQGLFTVRGKNAHAWPEVWFDGLGWVLFEPTPSRGAASAENYTNVPAAQDDTPIDEGAGSGGESAAAPTTTIQLPADDPQVLDDPSQIVPPVGEGASVPADEGSSTNYAPWLIVLAALLVAAALPAISRWWWRRMVYSTDEQLRSLWQRALRALADVGVRTSPTQTPVEAATHAGHEFPIAARPIHALAEVVTESTYRPEGSVDLDKTGSYGRSTIRECANWTHHIERATRDSATPWQRIVYHFTRWR